MATPEPWQIACNYAGDWCQTHQHERPCPGWKPAEPSASDPLVSGTNDDSTGTNQDDA